LSNPSNLLPTKFSSCLSITYLCTVRVYVYIGRVPLVYVYLHVMQGKCVGEVRKCIFGVLYLHSVVCLQHYMRIRVWG